MHRLHFTIIASITMFLACDSKKPSASLSASFVESLIKQKFEILEPYLPTTEFYKSLQENGPGQSDSVVSKFIEESNARLRENWTSISERIKTEHIDLSGVSIKESFSVQPFWNKKILRMVVIYNYKNKDWDDMEFVVGALNEKNFLLEIPNPGNVFSMQDSSLKVSNDLRFELEIKKPEFKKMLQDKVDKIISYAKENRIKELMETLAYGAVDTPGSKGSAADDAGNKQTAALFMEKINKSMEDCGSPTYGDVNNLNLPDGMWIVIQLKCSKKIVHFAFIRVNDQILLNDVDVIDNPPTSHLLRGERDNSLTYFTSS